MLRIYATMIDALGMLRTVLPRIESSGGVRTQRYRTALGSARETAACLDVATALGYLERIEPALSAKLDTVIGGLVRLTV